MPTVNLPAIPVGLLNKASILVGNMCNLISFVYMPNMHLHYLKHQKSAVYGAAAISDRRISGSKYHL